MMMKKFVMLMLVLGMASLATADLLLSVDGSLDPLEKERTIAPGEHLTLGVHAVPNSAQAYWMIVVDSALATLDDTDAITPQGNLSTIYSGYYAYEVDYWLYYAGLQPTYYPDDPQNSEVGGTLYDTDQSLFTGLIADLIDFQGEVEGDVLISLYESPDKTSWTWILADTVIIHQVIPEPMTMALLGLGGLLLRRKK